MTRADSTHLNYAAGYILEGENCHRSVPGISDNRVGILGRIGSGEGGGPMGANKIETPKERGHRHRPGKGQDKVTFTK